MHKTVNAKVERVLLTFQSSSTSPLSIEHDILPKLDILDSLRPSLGWDFLIYYPEEFIHPDAIELWSILVGFLYTVGYEPEGISFVLGKHMSILARTVRDPSNIIHVFEWMRNEAQYNEMQIAGMLNKCPYVLSMSVTDVLKPRVKYLERELSLSIADVYRACRRHPEMLTVDSNQIQKRVEYLRAFELSNKQMRRLFVDQPNIFTCKIEETLQPVVDVFVSTLQCEDDLVMKLVASSGLLTRKPESIRERITYWSTMFGVTPQLLRTILSKFPRFLLYPIETEKYRKKVEFLVKEMGFQSPAAALVKFPQYMSYCLPSRIGPRAAAAKQLASEVLVLSQLASKEEIFLKRYGISKEKYDKFVITWAKSEEARYWLTTAGETSK